MLALIDGNNFYASCEQVFQPQLCGKPLIVLSNNDGCAIARSDEAKALGIKMGQPLHQIPRAIRRQLAIRSANFTLYADMSARVQTILRQAVPRIEAYSIDESFLDLQGLRNPTTLAHELRQRVHRWTGIPNCIGIGHTKTLAKLGNHIAKAAIRKPGSYPAHLGGVADLGSVSAEEMKALLRATPVQEVWGVGRRWSRRLQAVGIYTAAQFKNAPARLIRTRFGVTLSRTQGELNGQACIALEEVEPDRQQIVVSRSFGARITDHDQVHQALNNFALRAAEKLRRRNLVAAAVGVFAHTDWFNTRAPQHHPQATINLLAPSSDSRVLLRAVARLQRNLLKPGMAYKKAGVHLLDLARLQHEVQADLFDSNRTTDSQPLMEVMDAINHKYGRGTIGLATSGWERIKPTWAMRQQYLSPRFSTCWSELPVVRC